MGLKRIPAIITLLLSLCSCDEGRIYYEMPSVGREGITAEASLDVVGWDLWPEGYSLAVAAFSEASEYALISKNIEFDENGEARIVLSGIPADVNSVEFCVIDRLRRRIKSFSSITDIRSTDTIKLVATDLDVSPAQVIQTEIFNTTCINCHGASNFAAAGLRLTHPDAFTELINMPSAVKPSQLRVEPYSSETSVLWQILSSDESSEWKYDHSVEVVASERLDLLRAWIDNGAKY